MITVIAFTGLFNISTSFMMHTSNMKSALWFQVIPFLTGAGCLVVAGKLAGLF